jgi:diguanylate cyclase (GGDEF)-like protein
VVALVSLLDHPATNTWSGGYLFLAVMGVSFSLGSVELWRLWRTVGREAGSEEYYWRTVRVVAVVASLLGLYYLARWVAFLAVGPGDPVFQVPFGSGITTLLTTVLLVVVSFSMSTLSNEQETRALRVRASRDGLTGLLNRNEFLRLAALEVGRSREVGTPAAVIVADLDHFKAVNDSYGHAVGDAVLKHFAAACRDSARATDLVGRLGGEEFALLLPGTSPSRAENVTAEISRRLRATLMPHGSLRPTASYGIARADASTDLDDALASADSALYRAKALGRDRAVRADSTSA